MVLGRVNRTAWGTKLLLTAVLASLVYCISSCHLLKAQHCSVSPNWCFTPPSAAHHPPPSVILRELKILSQKPATYYYVNMKYHST